jgi:hypothetical protein
VEVVVNDLERIPELKNEVDVVQPMSTACLHDVIVSTKTLSES